MNNNPSQSVIRELYAIQRCFEENKDEADKGGSCGNFADKMCGGNNGDGKIKQCLANKGIVLKRCNISMSRWPGGIHRECKVSCDGGVGCVIGDIDVWPIDKPGPYSTCGRFGIPQFPDPAPCVKK
jgi:hypothetical protein